MADASSVPAAATPPARILYPGVDFLTLSYVNKGSFTRAARPVAIFYGRP